jgi:hypothetical protein
MAGDVRQVLLIGKDIRGGLSPAVSFLMTGAAVAHP